MATSTSTVIKTKTARVNPPTLVLELNHSNETGPRVQWTEETIDNEHLNRKKSKCCCIYTKPHDPQSLNNQTTEVNEFDNCQHCRFHTESDYAAKPEERQPKIKLVVKKTESS
ncbi:unnamed protein product [Rotaria magnacalcarata]|uniref:E3 ubiquitin-protein ligase PPP1R11 n=2 Tax=Rotaria TaxID=231623 RepID=A0A816W711_9BILA|nr:unnamed protein product [Rotaria magnacalcarata]CAF3725998.1 unnamed protein product [Rotaria magnacalcarata]